jgi:hypothetical protein
MSKNEKAEVSANIPDFFKEVIVGNVTFRCFIVNEQNYGFIMFTGNTCGTYQQVMTNVLKFKINFK